MTEDKIKKIKKDYLSGNTYKHIQEKYSITPNQLKWLIQSQKWKRKSNRKNVQKGNKNAKGNKGGSAPKKNKNAVTTGEYERIIYDVLTDEEKEIYDKCKIEDEVEELKKDFITLCIRERRIIKKMTELQNKNKDMTIGSISKTQGKDGTETSTHATNTIEFTLKLDDSLTRIQEQKRRLLDSIHKIKTDDRRLELELIRLEREIAKEGAAEDNNIKDDSFIKALENSVEDVWDDYEQGQATS